MNLLKGKKNGERKKKIYLCNYFIHQCQLMTHSAACQGSLLKKGLLLGSVTAVRFCLLVLDSCSCCCLMQRSCFYKSSDATAVAICTAYSGSPWQNSEESDGTAWESGRPMFSYQIFCKWDVWALSSHLPLLSITPTPSVSYKIWIQLHRAYCFSYFMILGLSSLFLWLESFQSSSLFDSLFPYLLREQNARCLCIMNPLVAKN